MKYKVGDIVQYIKKSPSEFTGSMGVICEVCGANEYKIDWKFRIGTWWNSSDVSREYATALKLVATSSANETTP